MKLEHYKVKYDHRAIGEVPTPFTPEQALKRIHDICGCAGRFDCDCVSVVNRAHVELWTEANSR